MSDDATDALFDTSPRAMAERFGELAVARLRAGQNCKEAARLAFDYAIKALEEEKVVGFVSREWMNTPGE